MTNSIYERIKSQIMKGEPGTVFFPDSFVGVGSSEGVRLALMRLTNQNIIIRVAQGIYCYPKVDKWNGNNINPTFDEIANAIALRDRVRIMPTGDYVLNILGLSTQVVANAVFFTDGSSRRISVGKGKGILFKHTAEMRNFAYKSKMMQMVIFAIKEIGNGNVTDKHLEIIREHLSNVSEELFNEDIMLAPVWVRKQLKKVV